jgi:hypothetical protein
MFEVTRWTNAYESLSQADRTEALGVADLERLATSAYMLGREDEFVGALERAHQLHLDAGESARAVRCAFWIGLNFLLRGETSRAMGWFGRGRRLIEREGLDCVERGYLLIPTILEQVVGGSPAAAYATAVEAVEIGERFGDPDLVALVVEE